MPPIVPLTADPASSSPAIGVSTPDHRHPLDPLSAEEITATTAIVKRACGLGDSARFVYITLKEPTKADLRAWDDGEPLSREAEVLVRDREGHTNYEAHVCLSSREVQLWRERADIQPPIMMEEFLAAEEACKSDPQWQAAMRRRGIEDLDLAILDPWSLGYNGPDDAPTKGRFIRPLTWMRSGPGDNGYARPVEGLVVRFDLDQMRVVEVEDHGAVPLAAHGGNYVAGRIADDGNVPHFPSGPRSDLRTVDITQPDGTSFTVTGNEVRWQKWSLRIGFTPREGLVLHTVAYQDGERLRPILHRASLSEMFVPYGDPAPTHARKNVFDMGEYGVGILANSLELGCDCLGVIRYFDAVINDNNGDPLLLSNAVCMHEEDVGTLWKHTNFRNGESEVRRSRRLVISMIVTVGNYDYGFFWYLYQDGAIEYEVKLTGVISNGAVPDGTRPRHGRMVAPGVYGPHHQHFFNVRLDMAVDGESNTVVETEAAAVPLGPDNPSGNAWVWTETPLRSEAGAQRTVNPGAGRHWRIQNPNVSNALGDPVAYRLMPGEATFPLYQPGSHALARAGFTTRQVWVTAYDPTQRFAAGEYPNQHPGGDGLPAYAAADRSVENTDLVVWHTFGTNHLVRPEDWPVMPVARVGFRLIPDGFFDGNPGLDVAPTSSCHLPALELPQIPAANGHGSSKGCCHDPAS